MTAIEMERMVRMFKDWCLPHYDLISKLRMLGFKGWLIKNDGTVEEILHDMYRKEIEIIEGYIESKKTELFKDHQL